MTASSAAFDEDSSAVERRRAAFHSGATVRRSSADVALPVLNTSAGDDEAKQAAAQAKHVSLHRRFFTTGIITILTAGAGWGAVLLWQLGASGSFTGISVHHINAHGHAQIFGWVALFIMGFAYEIFPRIWRAPAVNVSIAQGVFVSMLSGLLLSIIGIATPEFSASYIMAFIGGLLQVCACCVFALQITAAALRRDSLNIHAKDIKRPIDASTAFILTALGWVVLMSIYSIWHTLAVMSAETEDIFLRQVRTWQSALRDVQVHGMALFMILGVSIRLLPGMFGLPKVNERRAWTGLLLLIGAVLLECTLLITSQLYDNFAIAAGLLLPWLMLPVGVGLIIWPWKLWQPLRFSDRSAKFVRIAYGWLFVSFGLLLFLPLYQWLLGTPFSHAYYGAARHAITVGFISQMIVGISSKMAPGLRGMNVRALPDLWIPFILINIGCGLRVSLQIASDWAPIAFELIGISGVLELTGLAFWAAHLLHVMWLAPKKEHGARATALNNS